MDTLEKIKKLRDARGWTNYKLSQASEVSHTTIRNLFVRNNLPSIQTLEAICKGFDITLAQFFAIGSELESRTKEQQELLTAWEMLSPEEKSAFLLLIKRKS